MTSKLPTQTRYLKTKTWHSNEESLPNPLTSPFQKRRNLSSARSPKKLASCHRRSILIILINLKTLRRSSLQKMSTYRLCKTILGRMMKFYIRQERTVWRKQWCLMKSRWWKRCKVKNSTTHQIWATVKRSKWKTRENCQQSFSCPKDTPTSFSSNLSSTAPWIFFTRMVRYSCLRRSAEWFQRNPVKNSRWNILSKSCISNPTSTISNGTKTVNWKSLYLKTSDKSSTPKKIFRTFRNRIFLMRISSWGTLWKRGSINSNRICLDTCMNSSRPTSTATTSSPATYSSTKDGHKNSR